ncbi:MAG: DVUA0089 family protein, partial [Chthoniobacterales bacterium]
RYHALALLLLAVALCPSRSTFAFAADGQHWTFNRTVVMHLSLGGSRQLQDGFTSFNKSAADALNIWNQYLVHMQFGTVVASSLPPADGDTDNSVFFSDTVYGDTFGGRTLAVTITSSRGSIVTETDVIFNNGETWDSYRGALQPGPMDFHRVALHEFGHVLGLNHPDDVGQNVVALMNSTVSNLDSLRPDDIAGARSLYDDGPNYLSTFPAPNLVNLSTRAFVGTGANVLIGGFIIQGSQPATVILRAIGHSLAARGISNPLTDPMIELYDSGGRLLAENDDWVSSTDAETIASYRLDPSNSRESALVRTLNPGTYTAIVSAFDNGDGDLTGVGLVELYDLHTTLGRAGNISARGQVLTENNILIGGFIVGGNKNKEVVVRGRGPSLADEGVANTLSDPVFDLVNASGNVIGSNDDWENDPNADKVRSVGLGPPRRVEAALYANLNPGAYTAVMRGFNRTTGVGLIEIYDLTPPPQ